MQSPPPRVVSLLPSATEMVCAVGGRAALVGVSHECDWPADVVGLPVVTSTRVRAAGTSAEVDRDVRAVLRDALAVYEIRTDVLAELRPDVVITQDLCDVCAVSLEDVLAAVRAVLGPDVRVVNLHPTRLEEVWGDLLHVGAALGAEQAAREALAGLRRRVEAVAARAERAALTEGRPRVLTIEWIDPVMIGGTWMPELVALAGGEPLVTRPGEHAPTLDAAALGALAPPPDVVLVKPCGFPLERTLEEGAALDTLLASTGWPAVREGRVWLADGNAFFNRPGPRLVESLEILAACTHPDAFEDLARAHAGSFRRRDVRA